MTSSIQLPGGNVGIKLRSGDIVDPIHLSLSSLVRMGDSAFDQVMQWLSAERVARAERQEQREAEMQQFYAETHDRLAVAAAAQAERDAQPATLGDLA
jgi:hypothetical protein